jgi:hypothetical protein
MAHSVCPIACGASSGLVNEGHGGHFRLGRYPAHRGGREAFGIGDRGGASVYCGLPLSAAQQRLSAVMVDYWTTFARRGSAWRSGTVQRLATSPGGGDFAREHQVAFWRLLTG